jgi:hypothetical protein
MDLFGSGRALLLSGTAAAVPSPHLWLILTDPDASGQVLGVMVVSLKSFSDRTVLLAAGEHPFIRHESSVDFGSARRLKVSRLAAAAGDGRCRLLSDLTPELLRRVRAGLHASPRTVHHIRDYARARIQGHSDEA